MSFTVPGTAGPSAANATSIAGLGAAVGDWAIIAASGDNNAGTTSLSLNGTALTTTPSTTSAFIITHTGYAWTLGGANSTINTYLIAVPLTSGFATTYTVSSSPAPTSAWEVNACIVHSSLGVMSVDGSATANNSTNSVQSPTNPGVTTTQANDILVWYEQGANPNTNPGPTGMTNRIYAFASFLTNGGVNDLATSIQASTGATGTITAPSTDPITNWNSVLVALKESSAVSGVVEELGGIIPTSDTSDVSNLFSQLDPREVIVSTAPLLHVDEPGPPVATQPDASSSQPGHDPREFIVSSGQTSSPDEYGTSQILQWASDTSVVASSNEDYPPALIAADEGAGAVSVLEGQDAIAYPEAEDFFTLSPSRGLDEQGQSPIIVADNTAGPAVFAEEFFGIHAPIEDSASPPTVSSDAQPSLQSVADDFGSFPVDEVSPGGVPVGQDTSPFVFVATDERVTASVATLALDEIGPAQLARAYDPDATFLVPPPEDVASVSVATLASDDVGAPATVVLADTLPATWSVPEELTASFALDEPSGAAPARADDASAIGASSAEELTTRPQVDDTGTPAILIPSDLTLPVAIGEDRIPISTATLALDEVSAAILLTPDGWLPYVTYGFEEPIFGFTPSAPFIDFDAEGDLYIDFWTQAP